MDCDVADWHKASIRDHALNGRFRGIADIGGLWPAMVRSRMTHQRHWLCTVALAINALYQIALPATHLRRYSGLVTAIQVFDLTHVYDAIILAQHRII